MVLRKSKPSANKWKTSRRYQSFPEIEQSEATIRKMGGWNTWVYQRTKDKRIREGWNNDIYKDIYTRCKNPFHDKRRK